MDLSIRNSTILVSILTTSTGELTFNSLLVPTNVSTSNPTNSPSLGESPTQTVCETQQLKKSWTKDRKRHTGANEVNCGSSPLAHFCPFFGSLTLRFCQLFLQLGKSSKPWKWRPKLKRFLFLQRPSQHAYTKIYFNDRQNYRLTNLILQLAPFTPLYFFNYQGGMMKYC